MQLARRGRSAAKDLVATGLCATKSGLRYHNTILILSHMRSGSTALSNVICSHPQVSGYGETHVPHQRQSAPGRVFINLKRRGAFQPEAPWLFDKVLHNALDAQPPDAFYQSRAIFLLRSPKVAILSICKLAQRNGWTHLRSRETAAEYYLSRLEVLTRHWETFERAHRWGVLTSDLFATPDNVVKDLGEWLKLTPELRNHYVSPKASQVGGGGDPVFSAQVSKILARADMDQGALPTNLPADLSEDLVKACAAAYAALAQAFQKDQAALRFVDG